MKTLLAASAFALFATSAHAGGDVVVSTPVQACAKVTTQCRELATSCVLPASAAPPCLWVNVNALTYPKGYQPVRMNQEQLDQNQKERRYAGDPPIPGAPPGGPKSLEITFVRGVQSGGTYTGAIAMRNTTGIDFGTVVWACEFREGGYKTGGGYAVFHVVPNNVIAVNSMSFHQNGTAQFSAQCELVRTEKLTRENARLHSFGNQRANVPLSSRGFWKDGNNNGSAAITD